MVLAGTFLREGFPPRLLVGAAVAFVGAIVIGVATSDASMEPGVMWGIGLCLIAALAYAAGVTLEKPVLASVPALNVTFLACGVGALVTAPFAPLLVAELGDGPPSAAAWLVYLGLFPTAIAFTTWAFALNRTSAGRLGATTYLVVPIAILLAWLILAEVPPLLALIGGAVSIVGVVIARSRGR